MIDQHRDVVRVHLEPLAAEDGSVDLFTVVQTDLAVDEGQSGYDPVKIGNLREAARTYMLTNPHLANKLIIRNRSTGLALRCRL